MFLNNSDVKQFSYLNKLFLKPYYIKLSHSFVFQYILFLEINIFFKNSANILFRHYTNIFTQFN